MPENVILLLRSKDVDFLAQSLDDSFDFKELIKNPVIGASVEAIDKTAGKISLNFLNKRVSAYIPNEYKDEIHAILNDIQDKDGNYDVAVSSAIAVLNQLKDKLNVSEFIKSLISSLLEIVKASLISLLSNKD